MINFYKLYNRNGLDKEHYGQLIELLHINEYTCQLKPIEHLIKKSPQCAFRYARDVIKGRWPEVEPIIMKSPRFSYCYARGVIKGRFIEAEPYIQRSSLWWNSYKDYFNI